MDTTRIDPQLNGETSTFPVSITLKMQLSTDDALAWQVQGINLPLMLNSTNLKGIINKTQLEWLSYRAEVKYIASNRIIKTNNFNLNKIKPSLLKDSFQTGNKSFSVLVISYNILTDEELLTILDKNIVLFDTTETVMYGELTWEQIDWLSNYSAIKFIRPRIKKDISIIKAVTSISKTNGITIREYNPARTIRPTSGSGSGSGNNQSGSGSGVSI